MWRPADVVLQVFRNLKFASYLWRPEMSGHRFEYSYISWSTMEGNTQEAWWDLWSRNKQWTDLPPHQVLRHRRLGEALFLGDGMVNVKYCAVHHQNLEHKPTWKMYLGFFFFLGREWLDERSVFLIQIRCWRYIARSGIAIIVRPTGTPEGLKVFRFLWSRETKAVEVFAALSGEVLLTLPGKWTPNTTFEKVLSGWAGMFGRPLWPW